MFTDWECPLISLPVGKMKTGSQHAFAFSLPKRVKKVRHK